MPPNISLAVSVWSVALLSQTKPNFATGLAAMKTALAFEPRNELVPLVVSAYLDRIDNRSDVDYARHLDQIYRMLDKTMPLSAVRTKAMTVVLVRSLVRLQLNSMAIESLSKDGAKKSEVRGKPVRKFLNDVQLEQSALVGQSRLLVATIKDREGMEKTSLEEFEAKLAEHEEKKQQFDQQIVRVRSRLAASPQTAVEAKR